MTTLATANFNDTLPVSPGTGDVNIKWQADPPTTAPRNISAYVQNLGGVEARSTTTEAITDVDCGWLLNFTNAAAVAVTLGQTGQILTLGANGDGSGYAVSDTFTIAGGTGGSGHVVAVAAGVPTAVAIDSPGHGYSVTSSAATTATSGVGTGMHVSIGTVSTAVRAKFVCAFYVSGAGGATLTPQSGLINGAANLSVASGNAGWLFWDGTNWEAVTGGGALTQPYDTVFSPNFTLDSSAVYDVIVFARTVTFPGNFAGSVGHCRVNPGSTQTITVSKNGSSIGTISISNTGVFTFATTAGAAQTFNAGDYMTFTNQSSADANMIMQVTLTGTR